MDSGLERKRDLSIAVKNIHGRDSHSDSLYPGFSLRGRADCIITEYFHPASLSFIFSAAVL